MHWLILLASFWAAPPAAETEALHPIHIVVTEVQWNQERQALEVIHRIFLDDLEAALERHSGMGNLRIGTEWESAQTDSLIAAYVAEHFKLTVDGKPVPGQMLGKVIADVHAAEIGVEYPSVPAFSKLEVENRLLLRVYADQHNIVKVSYQGQKKGLRFRRGHERDQLEFAH